MLKDTHFVESAVKAIPLQEDRNRRKSVIIAIMIFMLFSIGCENEEYINVKYGDTVCNDAGRPAIILDKYDAIIQLEYKVKYKDTGEVESSGIGFWHKC